MVPSSGFTAHSASAPLLLFPWLARALQSRETGGWLGNWEAGVGWCQGGDSLFFVAETALAPTPHPASTTAPPVDFHLNTPKYP